MTKLQNQTQKSKNQRRALKREEIVKKAAALFGQRGFRGVSVDNIVDDVGISKPTFYSYLESKDEIVWEIYEVIRVESLKLARTILNSEESAVEKLHKLLQSHLEGLVGRHEFYAVYFQGVMDLPKRLQTKHEAGQREYQKMVEEVIVQGIREGVFPNVEPRIAALGILGMCNWVSKWYKPDGPLGPKEIADTFFKMLVGPAQPLFTKTQLQTEVKLK